MTAVSWIALLTDYGRRDGFVAACHGVIARIAPSVRVIDITHDVPPQDVRHGAAVLAQTVGYLPPSVIVGVVDPGVGTGRRAVALGAGDHVLVGPDNGLLTWAADACGGVHRAVELTSPRFHLDTGATTFDGRDVFAPVAAHLAGGLAMTDLGPELAADDVVRLPDPWVRVQDGRLEAEVHVVDHFGNVALAARAADLEAARLAAADTVQVAVGDRISVVRLARSFAEVAAGELVVLVDSAGHVAVAANRGDAAAELGLRPGDRVVLSA
ncbi:SAM-dependent chlorinase/fluorinase [Haloactinopolyspora sp.]|uniref:SAM hydrolase/SAM-dependent halogenase family protein n=1 Tax=Haloactinopolyspora sp. TaxID=1966353 RepID=UPI00260D005B|nr:SAM-dependent chlorinase/fluorinase [Haloactinopolyspora sp.]